MVIPLRAPGIVEAGPTTFEPSRAEGKRRLDDFVPRAGSAYARTRNHDLGPGNRANVSVLSPYVRHRLVSEAEVCRLVLSAHAFSTAEKYVQEVCWRTYWKGWLERHPSVWPAYLRQVDDARATLDRDRNLRAGYERAIAGQTEIPCFNAWARELFETGYLHNHARMWFASIWIFTLRLPWALGADFFLHNLLDGDAASNTLGWRWVAGLQTKGKTYLARADNIATYTDGRFHPEPAQLASRADALEEHAEHPLEEMPHCPAPPPDAAVALLVHEDDLLAGQGLRALADDPVAVGVLGPDGLDRDLADHVMAFKRGACEDAALRLAGDFGVDVAHIAPGDTAQATARALVAWARDAGADTIVMSYAPVGPVADRLDAAGRLLERDGPALYPLLRDWDAGFWPHATKGFFKLKEQIPAVLGDLGIIDPAALPPSRQPGRSGGSKRKRR